MNLIRENKDFGQRFPGLSIKETHRSPSGDIKSCTLADKDGNLLHIDAGWNCLDFYVKAPPTKKYLLAGDIDGTTIRQVFDTLTQAEAKLDKFKAIVDQEHRDQVNLKIEEILE